MTLYFSLRSGDKAIITQGLYTLGVVEGLVFQVNNPPKTNFIHILLIMAPIE